MKAAVACLARKIAILEQVAGILADPIQHGPVGHAVWYMVVEAVQTDPWGSGGWADLDAMQPG